MTSHSTGMDHQALWFLFGGLVWVLFVAAVTVGACVTDCVGKGPPPLFRRQRQREESP